MSKPVYISRSWLALIFCVALLSACKHRPQPPATTKFQLSVIKKPTNLHGYLLLAPYEIFYWRFGQVMILDSDCHIVYHKDLHGPVFCFRQWKLGGHTYYSYIVNDSSVYHVPKINLAAGYVVLLDSAMNEIRRIHLLPYGDITTTNHQDLDLHDFILLSPDHYIAVCAYEQTANNIPDSLHPARGVRIVSPVIQEVSNGQVIWQWEGAQDPEFYAISTEQNHFGYLTAVHNYMHINAIAIDPADSCLLVSFRNTNQIIKLNRHTGKIIWRLGGKNSDFPLTADQTFQRQHDCKMINGSLVLFDNGDSATRPYSRILAFRLDEANKKVLVFNALNIPEPYSQYMGSVEKRGENYFICGGSSPYFVELNSKTGEVLMELKMNQAIYRIALADDVNGVPFMNMPPAH